MLSSSIETRYFSDCINHCLVWAQTHEWRGKHRLYTFMLNNFGHRLIRYEVGDRVFSIPVSELCFWLEGGPNNYYLEEFSPFCAILNSLGKPFTFIDLGADIGTVSSLVASRCENLHNVFAFEPNPNSFSILEHNLSSFNIASDAYNLAVSDFNGKASLQANLNQVNDHEGHIVQSALGETSVVSLDDWFEKRSMAKLLETLVVKIDVEGQEQQVIAGAKTLLSDAETVVLLLEIHPEVLQATHTTPENLFEEAEKVRGFAWFVPAVNIDKKLDRTQPFFTQFERKQYDVIGISIPR
jgi:FkbM family methyltransferase